MSHRFYSEPLTRCARRKGWLRVCLGWVLDQVIWLVLMMALAGVLWGLFCLWEWFTMAEGAGSALAVVGGGMPLPLAVVALPKGLVILGLVVVGGGIIIGLAIAKTEQGGRVRPTNVSPPPPAPIKGRSEAILRELREAMAREPWCEACKTWHAADGCVEAEVEKNRLEALDHGADPLETPVGAPGLNGEEMGRILAACLVQARGVRERVVSAQRSLSVEDYGAALLAAHDEQSLLIGCLDGLVERLSGVVKPEVRINWVDGLTPAVREMQARVAEMTRERPEYRGVPREGHCGLHPVRGAGDVRPDMLKHEQRTGEEAA